MFSNLLISLFSLYLQIKIDFNLLFPGKENFLLYKWSEIREQIIPLLKTNLKCDNDKKLFCNIEELAEGV